MGSETTVGTTQAPGLRGLSPAFGWIGGAGAVGPPLGVRNCSRPGLECDSTGHFWG